jgi:very-short-patch-repair endonuclease
MKKARALRRAQTPAERLLWAHLGNRRLGGAKFRRQQPIGDYIVDLVRFEHRLIVEVYGGHHNEPVTELIDQARTAWLEGQGYRVLRFWNNEVMGNLEGVLATVGAALAGEKSPSPQPSPVKGEGARPDPTHPSGQDGQRSPAIQGVLKRKAITLTPALSRQGRGGRTQPHPTS